MTQAEEDIYNMDNIMSEKIEILVIGIAQQQVFPTQSGKDQLLMQLNRIESFVGADAKLNINPQYKKID